MDARDHYRNGERMILLSNLSNQVSDLTIKINSLLAINNEIFNRLNKLDDRIPERRQGYWGGYWEGKKS